MRHPDAKSTGRDAGGETPDCQRIEPEFSDNKKNRKRHHQHIGRTISKEQFDQFYRLARNCRNGLKAPKRNTIANDKRGDTKHRQPAPSDIHVIVHNIIAQQQISVESGKIIQKTKFIPGTCSPKVLRQIFPQIRNEKRYKPQGKEYTLFLDRCLSDPCRENGHIKIQAYKKVNIPHLHSQHREVERNHQNVMQSSRKRLVRFCPSKKIINDCRREPQYPGQPWKKVINDRPYNKGYNKSCQTFRIKCRDALADRQKQRTCHHNKQRYGRPHKRAVKTTPKIIPRLRTFRWGYIIGTMYRYHHKDSNKLYKIKPYNPLVIFFNQWFFHAFLTQK